MKTFYGKQQRGGTVLGLIIGALVGLGAALAVAVYVTKVPVPFLNKNQPKGADTDAAEAKKNKEWDPNAPLAGKNQVKPKPTASGVVGTVSSVLAPASAPSPSVAPVPAPAPAAAAAAAPAPIPSAPTAAVKPKLSADPLGDLAKSKSDSKPEVKPDASSSPGADPFSYFVQAGAFRTPEDAEQQRARLLLMGFQAKVTEREQAGRTVYRVRLGPFDKKDDADKSKEKLDSNGMETALVRVQR